MARRNYFVGFNHRSGLGIEAFAQDELETIHWATLEILERRRAQGRSTHPHFWGGFVAAGDWE